MLPTARLTVHGRALEWLAIVGYSAARAFRGVLQGSHGNFDETTTINLDLLTLGKVCGH